MNRSVPVDTRSLRGFPPATLEDHGSRAQSVPVALSQAKALSRGASVRPRSPLKGSIKGDPETQEYCSALKNY